MRQDLGPRGNKVQNRQIKEHESQLDAMRARETNALAAAKQALNG